MDDIPIGVLFGALILLIGISAFFSGSETGLMSLNRYRLKHLTKSQHRGAMRASRLLEHPDRLIGLILLGNNFVNILASSIATVLALRLWGEAGIAIAAGLLTLVILIFAEVTPKTLAVLHPERFAFPASRVLGPLQTLLYPLVWLVNIIARGLMRLLGVNPKKARPEELSSEELRVVVSEAGALIPHSHQEMLTNILDLEKATVDDIMVPRNEMSGIDLDNDWEEILKQIAHSQHTRLPVYRGDINNIVGFLHMRNALALARKNDSAKEDLVALLRDPYFIPEGTSLTLQLLNFRRQKRRIGLVVDEYGDVRGLMTLEDILEEIVGEFTTDPSDSIREVHPQPDGTYLVDGSASIRDLNRIMGWDLPTDGPKTFSGLITEYMQDIPEAGTSLMLAGYPVEILQAKGNKVKTAQINPGFRQRKTQLDAPKNSA